MTPGNLSISVIRVKSDDVFFKFNLQILNESYTEFSPIIEMGQQSNKYVRAVRPMYSNYSAILVGPLSMVLHEYGQMYDIIHPMTVLKFLPALVKHSIDYFMNIELSSKRLFDIRVVFEYLASNPEIIKKYLVELYATYQSKTYECVSKQTSNKHKNLVPHFIPMVNNEQIAKSAVYSYNLLKTIYLPKM